MFLALIADGLPAAASELSDEESEEDSPKPTTGGGAAPNCFSSTNVQLSWHVAEGPSKAYPRSYQGWSVE